MPQVDTRGRDMRMTNKKPLKNSLTLGLGLAALTLGFGSKALAQANDPTAPNTAATKSWEWGVGLGLVTGPDYRGSKETRDFVSPFPYFVYRGKIFRSDREGVRGQFIDTDRLSLNVSLSAHISPEADENKLRRSLGLGELGSSLEIGPALGVRLWGDKSHGMSVILPLRSVIMIGGDDTGYQGMTFHPHLIYTNQFGQWGFAVRSGVSFATNDYHRYYYDIPAELGTTEYSAYSADGGYSGMTNQVSISRMIGNVRAAAFVRHDYLGGASFEDSPLVETKSSVRGGLAFIWAFK